MARNTDFSLTRVSLSSATWYFSLLAGWPLIAAALYEVATTPSIARVPSLAMTAVLLVVLELLPLVEGRGHDPQGVVMSTAFTVALLTIWGVWPAVILVAVAAVASDLRAGKAWWKLTFNPAQYALSVGAGFLVMLPFGHAPTLAHPLTGFRLDDMVWTVGVWVVYFLVNLALVGGVLAFTGTFVSVATDDLLHTTVMTFSVLAISPLIVVVAQSSWPLLPLLLVPLVLLYHTARMSLQREHAASHDPLTGLPNRASLQFELCGAITRHDRDGTPFGLILIDLDDFKRVNDTLGHTVGDELLRQFAGRLRAALRPSDHVSRLGGDEFAVLVFDAEEADTRIVADRIRASIASSINLSDISLAIELSIGIALCPGHAADADILLQRADVAMYVAKENRTVIEIYSAERDENSTDQLGLLGELRQAIEHDELQLHYQPKVSTCDGSLLGMEALVRWHHPTRGNIAPDHFIPLAERSGIMPLLTERVILLAVSQMARWRDDGAEVPVAVNIAPTDLVGDRLVRTIAAALDAFDLPARILRLEITERIVTQHLGESQEALRQLRAMGVTISLDDFGTGYSSLLRLSALPVDEIKIDRCFVACLSDGDQAVGIVRALIDLAHAIGVAAIAEGVENAAELRLLEMLGCDGVQGWHVAVPMATEDATQWLRDTAAIGPAPARPVIDPATPAGTPHAARHRDANRREFHRVGRSNRAPGATATPVPAPSE